MGRDIPKYKEITLNIVLPGAEAWEGLLRHKYARWPHNTERFSDSVAVVEHTPKFLIGPTDRFFCMGSCFARNVEEHLIYNRIRVLSRQIVSPASEWGGARINGFINKFTTLSMLNELDWLVTRPEINEDLFESTGEGWRDLQLSTGAPAVSLERAIERRTYLIDDYFARIRTANVIVLTLGLNETWFDTRTQRYLNEAPTHSSVRRSPDRYQIAITDVAANIEALERVYARLTCLNPTIRVIITVSPVPMFATFSGRDVAVANTYSKSVLRAAAEAIAANNPLVDYFPTFDMVSLSPRNVAYGPDCLHVSDRVVGILIRYFLKLYTGLEPVSADFSEVAYLAANADVEEAVRSGKLDSGFDHWTLYGQHEGRQMRPARGEKLELVSIAGA